MLAAAVVPDKADTHDSARAPPRSACPDRLMRQTAPVLFFLSTHRFADSLCVLASPFRAIDAGTSIAGFRMCKFTSPSPEMMVLGGYQASTLMNWHSHRAPGVPYTASGRKLTRNGGSFSKLGRMSSKVRADDQRLRRLSLIVGTAAAPKHRQFCMYRQVPSNLQDLHRTWLLLARRCCWIPESEVRLIATSSASNSWRRRPSNVAGVTYTQGS